MEKKKTDTSEVHENGEDMDKKLPKCTTAPSAEHTRASDDDEPCDDGRGGKGA